MPPLGRHLLVLCLGVAVLGLTGIAEGQQRKKAAPKKPPEPPISVPTRKITIAKVDPNTRTQVLASAKMIDKYVAANHAKYKVTPNEKTTDEQFVRRAYLDITGSIPTYKQTRAFLNNRDPEKRTKLIDTLLNTPEAAGHLYNYWADILRLRDREVTNNAPGRPYNEWVKESIETNKPFDQWVYEMLTAEGKYLENPATGYLLRDSGMPLDSMNNTVRIFLGTQIGCAQCHDHPFDKWKRKEFYEVAAYTFGTAYRRGAGDKMFGGGNVVNKMREELKKIDDKFDGGGKYNRFLNGNLIEVYDNNAKLTLPHDYQYDDAKPKAPVTPRTIFDPQPTLSKGDSPRVVFAKWLTSPENPRFAKTIANRMWKRLFGVGQIEPVDDMHDETVAENPELMDFLTKEMVRVKFDVKEYLRILLNTEAYQREASHEQYVGGSEYHFPGPILRRMTPEQVWDSFITLAVFSDYQAEPARVQADVLRVDLAKVSAEEIYKRDQELRELTDSKHRNARDKNFTYQGQLLARAAELPCPMPPNHFLRQFGQSDRESIEASSTEGSVPQVLQMFNGAITHMILDPRALMFSTVNDGSKTEDKTTVIFLSVLSRRPTAEEKAIAMEEVKTNGNAGYGNVIWALVNTREFLFVQ
uniref:DUF1549 domain-containing protein n=1 Tax=Schlesneria paludicola TaxID=360056 RepID=A0A7C2JYR4_9PLAN